MNIGLPKLKARADVIFKQSFIYTFGSLGSGALEIVLVPIYTRAFTTQEYGILDFLWTFVFFARLIVPLGIDQAIARFYIDSDDEGDRQCTATTGLIVILVLTLMFAFVVTLTSGIVANLILQDVSRLNLIVLMAWSTLGLVLYSFFINLLRYDFRPRAYVLLSLTTLFADALATIAAVLLLRAGLAGVYVAKIFVYTFASAAGLWLTRHSYAWRFDFNRLRSMIGFGLPLVPTALSYFVMSYSGRYFLARLTNLESLGMYGAAHRFASILALLYIGFSSAWGPFVLGTYSQPQARQVFMKVFDYFSSASVVAIVGISLFAEELLRFYAGPAYASAACIVPLLLVNQALYVGGGYIFGIGFSIAKRTVQRAFIGLIAATVCLAFQALLIPRLGIVGAAGAVTLSLILFTLMSLWWGQRYYSVPYRLVSHGKLYGIGALAVIISAATHELPVSLYLPIRLVVFAVILTMPFFLRILSLSVISSLVLKALHFRHGQSDSQIG